MGNPIDSLGYALPGVRSVQFVGDGVAKAWRALRDGTLSFADFKLVCALAGIVFTANVGSLVTPISGHVAVSQLQPEFNLDVPTGTMVIVLPPNVYLETSAGTLNRVIAASINQAMGEGTSAAMTLGPTSSRSDRPTKSACDARQAFSGNGAAINAPVSQIEHWRSGYPFADATGAPVKQFTPSQDNWPFPVLVGPASFQLYWAATTTAPSGWAQASWIELPANFVS